MKTSTKVIVKFQIFTSIILVIVLFLINILFFDLGIRQYDKKIERIINSNLYNNIHGKGGKFRNWQIVKTGCFVILNKVFCLKDGEKNIFGIYHIKDSFFIYRIIYLLILQIFFF